MTEDPHPAYPALLTGLMSASCGKPVAGRSCTANSVSCNSKTSNFCSTNKSWIFSTFLHASDVEGTNVKFVNYWWVWDYPKPIPYLLPFPLSLLLRSSRVVPSKRYFHLFTHGLIWRLGTFPFIRKPQMIVVIDWLRLLCQNFGWRWAFSFLSGFPHFTVFRCF